MTIDVGVNLRLIGILVVAAVLIIRWWAFRARRP